MAASHLYQKNDEQHRVSVTMDVSDVDLRQASAHIPFFTGIPARTTADYANVNLHKVSTNIPIFIPETHVQSSYHSMT